MLPFRPLTIKRQTNYNRVFIAMASIALLIMFLFITFVFHAKVEEPILDLPIEVKKVNPYLQKIFVKKYQQKIWDGETFESHGGSGGGSTLEYTGKTIGLLVDVVFPKYGVKSFIDASCGAMVRLLLFIVKKKIKTLTK